MCPGEFPVFKQWQFHFNEPLSESKCIILTRFISSFNMNIPLPPGAGEVARDEDGDGGFYEVHVNTMFLTDRLVSIDFH